MTDKYTVNVLGAACRLPGAPHEDALWEVLDQKCSTVGKLPSGRWNPELHFHPNPRAPGSSYTFAGGFLPDPFGFDIGVFGMSPREAAQLDPQQRLLAEVVWDALEDARIPPSSLAGSEVGVYIGVSALDHANLFGGDTGAIESHFMSGNTLSIVANRISYLFDLRGPSLAVDTACSSSLVAVDRAMADLMSGRIDTAIVGGVNMLLSPAAFIGFSRASMLSPTGACRPFSADGDGYVRSEGAVAFVLRREKAPCDHPVRAIISASAVNSDGRTSGIALPGLDGQVSLLERVYRQAELDADDITFVEAHGTGTAVGDPIEATALGQVIGMRRAQPLPIGSVKSNIGHLEPASGVAGMMKAILALEKRSLPATLHLDRLNPNIDFERLNLLPTTEAMHFEPNGRPLHCGVSSFGFGGTNAHVVLTSAPQRTLAPVVKDWKAPEALVISTACRDALLDLAARHAELLKAGVAPARLADAVATGRQVMRHRAVLPLDTGENMAAELEKFASGQKAPRVLTGATSAQQPKICFVYSGNGAQWVGMGRTAYNENAAFAQAFDEADRALQESGLDSIREALFADDLADRLGTAACAQPLIFGIQAALTAALAARGMKPQAVLGHSVGEIAAAHAAGILDLTQAARILAARARSQEAVRGTGGMATFAASRGDMVRFMEELPGGSLGIAADNAPNSVTISGSADAIDGAMKAARRARIAGRRLDIDYPYHSELLDGIREDFLAAVGVVQPQPPTLSMFSTVTGRSVDSTPLDAPYWWHNVRSEVLFQQAVKGAAAAGCNLFVEISPRPIMVSPVSSALEDAGQSARVIHSLSEADDGDRAAEAGWTDPIGATVARAIANGFDAPRSMRERQPLDRSTPLPRYPWQQRTFRIEQTSGAIDIHGLKPRHPLIGSRLAQGLPEWRTMLDTELVPYLGDHVVGGETIVPATALAEMALAVARELSPEGPLSIVDFDIVQALVIPAEGQREVSVRYAEGTGSVEIYSRPRFGPDEWTLCARGLIAGAPRITGTPPVVNEGRIAVDADTIYRTACDTGIDYGDSFRLLCGLRRDDDEIIEVDLAEAAQDVGIYSRQQILHPASVDAGFHGLFDLLEIDPNLRQAWVPIRFERVTVWRDHAAVTSAVIVVDRSSEQLKTVTLWLRDASGAVVARIDRALLRPVVLSQKSPGDGVYHLTYAPAGLRAGEEATCEALARHLAGRPAPEPSEGRMLLRAHMWACAHRALAPLANPDGTLDVGRLVAEGKLAHNTLTHVTRLLDELASAGLVSFRDDAPVIAAESGLPGADAILATFAQDFPLAATDLLLSAHAEAELETVLRDGGGFSPRPTIVERQESDGLFLAPVSAELLSAIRTAAAIASRKLHVIIVAHGAARLVAGLTEEMLQGRLHLTIAAESAAALERIARRIPADSGLDFLDLSVPEQPAMADIVVAISDGPSANDDELSGRFGALLRAGGALLLGKVRPDTLRAFQLGDAASPASWQGSDVSIPGDVRLSEVQALGDEKAGFSIRLLQRDRAAAKPRCRIRQLHADPAFTDAVGAGDADNADIACIIGVENDDLARTILSLQTALLEYRDDDTAGRFWAVCAAPSAAPQAALSAFMRVAMNEYANRDVRLIEIEPGTPVREAADALTEIVAAPGAERIYRIDGNGRSVARLLKGAPRINTADEKDDLQNSGAMALRFSRTGMLDQSQWVPKATQALGPHDIEVEVAASGLNFRDVMLATGLLNDDVVDEGPAGPVYGLECAGRVRAVGEAVTRHRPGDLVFGFGKNTFATHVVSREESFVTLPEGISLEAGAGIPVAFYTAWYSLIEMARLRKGEKVLIHGGAGGVGLAAIQIARAVGAEVVATVSTPDKRALATLFGAQHLCDSRSLDFAEYVKDELGGVDVVLNSLSGEAMQASLRCLKPRGRFIELGKRDYVANTAVGLRTFRRNISYFGVDVDQVLAVEPELTVRGLREIAAGFEDAGSYMPLPCMTFDAVEIGSAFRLMQSAGHVGKIVVRPPSTGRLKPGPVVEFTPADGVHLIVGGTRGFGLATALWLAENGARKIVVASRSGMIEPSQAELVEAAREQGCTFIAETVDVTDLADVEALVTRIASAHGPIVSIYHTAVTLQDGMIETLSSDALEAILPPKVTGALNLDRATRSQPVEQFVLFSSASALVGNPGQSAYGAANGFLEGLARERRRAGLPALAVAWGAIADVGLLADRADTMSSLGRLTGVAGMHSADALDRLGRILPIASLLDDPVVSCTDFTGEGALSASPLLSSPAFAKIFTGRGSAITEGGKSLAELVEGKSDVEAIRVLTGVVAEQVAQILRLGVQEIDLDASIDSLGMDSLMALELRMSLETEYKISLPVMSITAVSSLRDLGQRLLQIIRNDGTRHEDEAGITPEESHLIEIHSDRPLKPVGSGWPDEERRQSSGART